MVSALPYDEDEKFWNEDYKETNGNRVPVFEYDYVAAKTFSRTGVSAVTACSIPNSGHISIWSRR